MVRTKADASEPSVIVIMTTVANQADAEKLADGLIENRLAACVQILPPMRSVYIWQGEVQRETEHLLLIKTLRKSYPETERFILENHPYETPEIVAVAAEKVSRGYLNWVTESVDKR